MLKQLASKPDWFVIDQTTAKPLWGPDWATPGLKRHPREPELYLVHRNQLPLLQHPDAIKFCTERRAGDWRGRDLRTQLLGFELRTSQQQAIDFIEPRRGTLLGDSMRLGKTLSCIMSHDPKRGPLVVVAPLSTRGVWLGWIKRVFPEVPIGICIGRKIDREKLKLPIVFIHYDLIKDWQTAMPIGTLVLDEGQALVNRSTKRTLAAAVLASRAEKVIVATGTPIWDRPKDLWSIASILAPGAWGDYYAFGRRYGAPIETAYGVDFPGISNADELRTRLSEVMIRRLWKDVQSDLPPITRSIVVSEVDEATRRKLDVLAGKLKSDRTNTAGNLSHYRSQLCKVKLKTVVEEAKRTLAQGGPLVIWTWHKAFAADIVKALEDPSRPQAHLITGDVSPDLRDEIIGRWRNEPNGVLVSTMATLQVGVDLSHASDAIFAELDWVPPVIAQTEMRTYDPKRPMCLTFVVADHVIDQRIIKALISKLGSSDPVGLGSAIDAIEAIRDALHGPNDEGDMARFMDDLLASGVN